MVNSFNLTAGFETSSSFLEPARNFGDLRAALADRPHATSRAPQGARKHVAVPGTILFPHPDADLVCGSAGREEVHQTQRQGTLLFYYHATEVPAHLPGVRHWCCPDVVA